MTHPKDDRREATEVLITLGLNVLFLALTALVFWPLDKVVLALLWAKGYAVYWLAVVVSMLLLTLLERLFRVDINTHYKVYVGLNLVVSAVLVAGWSAFGALAVGRGRFDRLVGRCPVPRGRPRELRRLYSGNGVLQGRSLQSCHVAAGSGERSPFRRVAYRWVDPLRLVLCIFRKGKVTKETRSCLF